MTIVVLLKKILSIAIFVGLTWAIFYFAGKFWGFLWLGFWVLSFVLLLLLMFGGWLRKRIYGSDRMDIPKFKPKP